MKAAAAAVLLATSNTCFLFLSIVVIKFGHRLLLEARFSTGAVHLKTETGNILRQIGPLRPLPLPYPQPPTQPHPNPQPREKNRLSAHCVGGFTTIS